MGPSGPVCDLMISFCWDLKSGKRSKWKTILFLVDLASEKVAFSVHIQVSDTISMTKGNIVIFNEIVTNLGDGYNKDSGSFTAPVSGVYSFSLYFMTSNTAWSYLGIYVNGESQCNVAGHSAYGVSGCSVIKEIKTGDVVNVRVAHGATLYTNTNENYRNQNGFVGMLYKPL